MKPAVISARIRYDVTLEIDAIQNNGCFDVLTSWEFYYQIFSVKELVACLININLYSFGFFILIKHVLWYDTRQEND